MVTARVTMVDGGTMVNGVTMVTARAGAGVSRVSGLGVGLGQCT